MLNTVLLQQAQGGGMSGMLMIVAMIAIFYFVMIRPQNKKQKEIKRQREAMKKGDRVVTAGGIHGKIRSVQDDAITMEIAPGVNIKIDKTSVFPLNPAPANGKQEKADKKADKEAETEVEAEAGENPFEKEESSK